MYWALNQDSISEQPALTGLTICELGHFKGRTKAVPREELVEFLKGQSRCAGKRRWVPVSETPEQQKCELSGSPADCDFAVTELYP